jgi:beta-lactamase class A
MTTGFTRRAALGGAGTSAALALAKPAAAAPAEAAAIPGPGQIRRKYAKAKAAAGGTWSSHIALLGAGGTAVTPVLEDDADKVVKGFSVMKLAVATAVMERIDQGGATLGQTLDLPNDRTFILEGSGIYHLHGVWGDQITIDQITIANFLTAMLLVSDNTAVRMCARVVPGVTINEILAAKGFEKTRVEPVGGTSPRFFLGVTTPRETHQLLQRLGTRTLLKPASCDFLLKILRSVNGYHDGVRRVMSSNERSRVAVKYGAAVDDSIGLAGRHEVGIMFGVDGRPVLTFAMFAHGLGQLDNYGSTHPAVEAHAVVGRAMFDAIANTAGGTPPNTSDPPSQPSLPEPFRQVDPG